MEAEIKTEPFRTQPMGLLLTIETPKRPKGTDADQGNCKGDSRHPQPDNGRHWQEGGKSLKDDEAQAGANNRAEALALSLSASEHLAAMAVHRILGVARAHKREPRCDALGLQDKAMGGCRLAGNNSVLRDEGGKQALGASLPQAQMVEIEALAISSRLALLGRGLRPDESLFLEATRGKDFRLLRDGRRNSPVASADAIDQRPIHSKSFGGFGLVSVVNQVNKFCE